MECLCSHWLQLELQRFMFEKQGNEHPSKFYMDLAVKKGSRDTGSPWQYFNSSHRMESHCGPRTDQECHQRDAVEASNNFCRQGVNISFKRYFTNVHKAECESADHSLGIRWYVPEYSSVQGQDSRPACGSESSHPHAPWTRHWWKGGMYPADLVSGGLIEREGACDCLPAADWLKRQVVAGLHKAERGDRKEAGKSFPEKETWEQPGSAAGDREKQLGSSFSERGGAPERPEEAAGVLVELGLSGWGLLQKGVA
ncbi:hypothetical protein KIL84_023372 [Mauremys mutica]|uniref:Uncharacterized protein n=1 Tax=Mauremys mutica TaxID=74926 RepID=A0A9D3WSH3_9SAUR|nr:hypothetical protein KIL84_023372 [Mauremys mutica]